jgi:hypothetical protein
MGPSGINTLPDDVPDNAKKRFGHVGPGKEENHLSQTVKFDAN